MNEAVSVLVTGSSGNVGAPLVAALAGTEARVVATRVRGGPDPGGIETKRLDFEDADSFAPALDGISRVFLMRPPQISDTKRFIRPFIEAMSAAGVEHVVFLSLMGVNRAMPHWRVEQDLRASTLSWTFLRPSFFAQNLGAAYRNDIRDHDRIRLASGHGRTSFIDTNDIAEAAANILVAPERHRGTAYTLTGPEALDYHQVASLLSATLGRRITYQPIGFRRYRRELQAQGLPGAYVNVQLLINVVARLGFAGRVDDALPRLLGRAAGPLEAYIAANRTLWLAE